VLLAVDIAHSLTHDRRDWFSFRALISWFDCAIAGSASTPNNATTVSLPVQFMDRLHVILN
jgi:hypothetical protein